VIDAVRLAETLSALKDGLAPTLADLRDAAVTLLGQGEPVSVRETLARVDVGTAVGRLPKGVSQTSIQADFDRELGRLTHLVYNAGTTGGYSRLEDADPAMMRAVLELNVLGALLCVKAAAQRMSSKKGGQGGAIVLISSMAAVLGSAGEYVWYAASKGAIDSMTVGLSRELAADNIRVNAVAPGLIETGLHPPGRLERLAPMMPIPRAGTPDEVAEAVMFLLSEASSYTTGTNLRVSGGR